ncbi:unnamed protein product [Adineta ricciae]|uniref:Uncharacterized protein n=1 Tax=Adineta ricciae TaxID=249248 RepID=A0A813PG86_ADIRI|nr:unnamed protein product [Adineta ricciae]CAF1102407.1 unnamed protein product [Adineta ricciae]
MHEVKQPKESLQDQLKLAKEEIHSLQQQLKCLFDLTKSAWHGDQSAIIHLAELIGVDPEIERNAFNEKKIAPVPSTKKTVTIADNEEILSKRSASISSTISHEDRREQKQRQQKTANALAAAARNAYLQPFLKQNHIDPVREQNTRQLLMSMMRYRQSETRNPPSIPTSRASSASVRPRATKHLYHLASPDHVVKHLGSPASRAKPYFVFAGKEFFQQTANYAPLYEKGFITENGSRHSEHSSSSDDLNSIPSPTAEPVIGRPHTAKSTQPFATLRSSAQSRQSENPARISSAKSTTMSERDRRDAMRLQRQLNIPRQGWVNQYS